MVNKANIQNSEKQNGQEYSNFKAHYEASDSSNSPINVASCKKFQNKRNFKNKFSQVG
jgi:hypothetical protein